MKIDLDKVPAGCSEALQMFLKALSTEEKKAFAKLEEKQTVLFHHTWGQELRNEWSMWEPDTPLVNNFKSLGITNADNMIKIIFVSAWRTLNKKAIRLQEQIDELQGKLPNEKSKL